MKIAFVIPGDINLPTGGYRYDRNIVNHINAAGNDCEVYSVEGTFPFPTPDEEARILEKVSALHDFDIAVVDGLAGGSMPALIEEIARETAVVALIHHPLCLENGLKSVERDILERSEREGLAFVRGVITTSSETASEVAGRFSYPTDQIATIVPGVDRGKLAVPRQRSTISLLCVGSLVERKGHKLLIEALGNLKHLNWNLDCYGLTDADLELKAEVEKLINALGLNGRINFRGSVSEETLENAYTDADVFVLPSYYEGYGMAYAEAIVRGLPVIGTTGGAIPGTVPQSCGILVEPGNLEQLTSALEKMICDFSLRSQYHQNALAIEPSFPTWQQSSVKFLKLLEDWS